MTEKDATTVDTTDETAGSAATPGPVPAISGTELPPWVIDALGAPEHRAWRWTKPGDCVAGMLVDVSARAIDRLDLEGTREVPVVLLHGITLEDGVPSTPAYIEVVGMATVLERICHDIIGNAQIGQPIRITYKGHMPSQTKGHSDYADFGVAWGPYPEHVPLDVVTASPVIQRNAPDEQDGEPF